MYSSIECCCVSLVLVLLIISMEAQAELTQADVSTYGTLKNSMKRMPTATTNATTTLSELAAKDPSYRMEHTNQIRENAKALKKEQTKEIRARAARVLQKIQQPPQNQLQRLPDNKLEEIKTSNKHRTLGWFSSSSTASDESVLADPAQEYDKWAQAYRMLGAYIDCDHLKGEGDDHKSGDNNQNYYENESACSRWMLWAAYVNPNYQGNGYYEYFGDEPTSELDCHEPDTEWELLGVYRQEFYQFIEQISKHLWAVDDYNYIVALAGLSYMTDYDCFATGAVDSNGNYIYVGVAPQPYGKFQMALYTDTYCLEPDTSLDASPDDYLSQTEINLGSKDQTDDDGKSWAYDWWYGTQEYTLTQLNDVYEEFKYCTACMDYPTYQDGYFIGDYGTDDDNLINQCWKFYSHDSYTCGAECVAMAHAQGTIMAVKFGDTTFGEADSNFYQSSAYSSSSSESSSEPTESNFSRLLANAFLTASFLLFIATFLAFAVARRSRFRESRSSRSCRLLDDEEGEHVDEEARSRRSRRSSKSKPEEGDGIFRAPRASPSEGKSRKTTRSSSNRSSRKRRSKSRDGKSGRSRSAGRYHESEDYY